MVMKDLGKNNIFWQNKKVLITGHTGFKGSWLTLVLTSLGSRVWGYSLKDISNYELFKNLENKLKFVKCNLLTVHKIIVDKKEKLTLTKKFESISVIDMEAYYIKKELSKTNIPMASFKVIFDDLSFDIPFYIAECINDEGELKKIQFLMKLILNPKRILELLKVNAKFSKSKKVLESLINSF